MSANLAEISIEKEPASAGPDMIEKSVSDMQPVGLKLAAARRAKGLALQDVAAGVKIKITHLAAIESGDRASLPAVPFTAGFIKAYAQFVGLDPEELAAAYRREAGVAAAPVEPETALPSAGAAADAAPAAPAPATATPSPLQWETPAAAALAAPKREFSFLALPIGPQNIASYFGIGAAAFCVAWFGMSALMPRQPVEAPVRAKASPTEQTVAAAPAPVTETEIAALETATTEADAALAVEVVNAETPTVVENEVANIAAVEPEAKKVAAPSLKSTKAKFVSTAADDAVRSQAGTTAYEAAADPVYWQAAEAELTAANAPVADEVADLRASIASMNAVKDVTTPDAAVETPAMGEVTPIATTAADGNVVPARILKAAEPEYPERCVSRAAAAETVDVIFAITADGRPVSATVLSTSNPCFNTAAVNAAYKMRFAPRMVGGKAAIETGRIVTLRFAR